MLTSEYYNTIIDIIIYTIWFINKSKDVLQPTGSFDSHYTYNVYTTMIVDMYLLF